MTVDRKLPRYCGLQKDLKMESDGAFFRVTFKSNDRFDGTGFYASYQFTPVADAVTITRRRSSSPASSSPCKKLMTLKIFDRVPLSVEIIYSAAEKNNRYCVI